MRLMPDPTTTLGLAALASYVGKEPLQRLLGPTCDMLGRRFSNLTESGIDAVGRIVRNARAKAGHTLEQPGSIPPRVVKEIIDAGSGYTEDISIEYMGGVLASSRTPLGRDDRGARMAKLVDRMTTYQLRTHYLIYSSIKHLFVRHNPNFSRQDKRMELEIFIPFSSYFDVMEFTQTELDSGILHHIFSGLEDETLIAPSWRTGTHDVIVAKFGTATEGGCLCYPSAVGAELFLWAFGYGQKPLEFIFDESFSARIEGLPPHLGGVLGTRLPTTSSPSESS